MADVALAIDVAGELCSLCEAQLRGTWQLPAEIVRLAVRRGAPSVSIARRRGRWVFRWPHPLVDRRSMERLRTALDDRVPTAERHRAIVAIEAAGDEALLWAAGVRGARLAVISSGRGDQLSLTCPKRGRPRVTSGPYEAAIGEVVVSWSCAGLDSRRATDWLRAAVRFVDRPVSLDGGAAPRGFSRGLFQIAVERPLPCRIALTRDGDDPLLWLLKDQVVAARAGIPGLPAFEAAVEMAGAVLPNASAADLRRAVNRHLGGIIEQAVWMMVEVVDRLSGLPEPDRQRIIVLCLKAARTGSRAAEILELPLLPTLAGNAMSVRTAGELAHRRGGVLQALEPGAAAAQGVLDPAATLRLSLEARSLVAALAGIRFRTPRRRRASAVARARSTASALGSALARRLRGLLPRRRLAVEEQSAAERRLLALLRAELQPLEFAMAADDHGPGLRGGTLVLGRRDPVVSAAARAVARDPRWLYAAVLALEISGPSEDLRRRWRGSIVRQ